MTKKDALDRLGAIALYDSEGDFGPSWDQLDEDDVVYFRDVARPYWEEAEKIFMEWLLTWNHETSLDSERAGDILVEEWRKDFGGA